MYILSQLLINLRQKVYSQGFRSLKTPQNKPKTTMNSVLFGSQHQHIFKSLRNSYLDGSFKSIINESMLCVGNFYNKKFRKLGSIKLNYLYTFYIATLVKYHLAPCRIVQTLYLLNIEAQNGIEHQTNSKLIVTPVLHYYGAIPSLGNYNDFKLSTFM